MGHIKMVVLESAEKKLSAFEALVWQKEQTLPWEPAQQWKDQIKEELGQIWQEQDQVQVLDKSNGNTVQESGENTQVSARLRAMVNKWLQTSSLSVLEKQIQERAVKMVRIKQDEHVQYVGLAYGWEHAVYGVKSAEGLLSWGAFQIGPEKKGVLKEGEAVLKSGQIQLLQFESVRDWASYWMQIQENKRLRQIEKKVQKRLNQTDRGELLEKMPPQIHEVLTIRALRPDRLESVDDTSYENRMAEKEQEVDLYLKKQRSEVQRSFWMECLNKKRLAKVLGQIFRSEQEYQETLRESGIDENVIQVLWSQGGSDVQVTLKEVPIDWMDQMKKVINVLKNRSGRLYDPGMEWSLGGSLGRVGSQLDVWEKALSKLEEEGWALSADQVKECLEGKYLPWDLKKANGFAATRTSIENVSKWVAKIEESITQVLNESSEAVTGIQSPLDMLGKNAVRQNIKMQVMSMLVDQVQEHEKVMLWAMGQKWSTDSGSIEDKIKKSLVGKKDVGLLDLRLVSGSLANTIRGGAKTMEEQQAEEQEGFRSKGIWMNTFINVSAQNAFLKTPMAIRLKRLLEKVEQEGLDQSIDTIKDLESSDVRAMLWTLIHAPRGSVETVLSASSDEVISAWVQKVWGLKDTNSEVYKQRESRYQTMERINELAGRVYAHKWDALVRRVNQYNDVFKMDMLMVWLQNRIQEQVSGSVSDAQGVKTIEKALRNMPKVIDQHLSTWMSVQLDLEQIYQWVQKAPGLKDTKLQECVQRLKLGIERVEESMKTFPEGERINDVQSKMLNQMFGVMEKRDKQVPSAVPHWGYEEAWKGVAKEIIKMVNIGVQAAVLHVSAASKKTALLWEVLSEEEKKEEFKRVNALQVQLDAWMRKNVGFDLKTLRKSVEAGVGQTLLDSVNAKLEKELSKVSSEKTEKGVVSRAHRRAIWHAGLIEKCQKYGIDLSVVGVLSKEGCKDAMDHVLWSGPSKRVVMAFVQEQISGAKGIQWLGSEQIADVIHKEVQAERKIKQRIEHQFLIWVQKVLEKERQWCADEKNAKKVHALLNKKVGASESVEVVAWQRASNVIKEQLEQLSDFSASKGIQFFEQLPENITMGQLIRWSTRWHEEQVNKTGGTKTWDSVLDVQIDWKKSLSGTDRKIDEGYSVHEIVSEQGLQMEGKALHHCVGSYSDRCMDGTSRIFSIKKDAQRCTTLELRSDSERSLKGWHEVVEGAKLEWMKAKQRGVSEEQLETLQEQVRQKLQKVAVRWSLGQNKGLCNREANAQERAVAQLVLKSVQDGQVEHALKSIVDSTSVVLGESNRSVEWGVIDIKKVKQFRTKSERVEEQTSAQVVVGKQKREKASKG